jgi:hypothetical protein
MQDSLEIDLKCAPSSYDADTVSGATRQFTYLHFHTKDSSSSVRQRDWSGGAYLSFQDNYLSQMAEVPKLQPNQQQPPQCCQPP